MGLSFRVTPAILGYGARIWISDRWVHHSQAALIKSTLDKASTWGGCDKRCDNEMAWEFSNPTKFAEVCCFLAHLGLDRPVNSSL